MPIRHVIAIDGPAASGKSSVAQTLARKLGYAYLNSGAFYRALTWHLLQSGVPLKEDEAMGQIAARAHIRCDFPDNASRVWVGGGDASPHLRSEAVNRAVSHISSIPRIREIVDAQMRAHAAERDMVIEGRDIGSVVFPETPFKFYLDASPDVRAHRRLAQGERDEITVRDRADSSRDTAPLVIAPDATVIDTSQLTIPEVVEKILAHLAGARSRKIRREPNRHCGALRKGTAAGSPEFAPLDSGRQMNGWYWAGYNLSKLIGKTLFHYRVLHPERMIQTGPVILAMNHQSYLDPPLAGIACQRPIYFLARKSLLNLPLLGPILPKVNVIPVDQEGGDRSALKAILRILRAGEGTLVFPEGSRTLDGNLQPAQPGLGFIIAKTLAPVVPMRIFGAHEALPRGSSRLRLHPITVVIGRALRFTPAEVAGGGKERYQEIAQRVMNEIARLQIDGTETAAA